MELVKLDEIRGLAARLHVALDNIPNDEIGATKAAIDAHLEQIRKKCSPTTRQRLIIAL